MRRDTLSHRSLAIGALAVGLSACNGNNGLITNAPGECRLLSRKRKRR